MKKVIAVLILMSFSSMALASIGKVVSFPIRHPRESGKFLKHAARKSGHVAKKILY